MANPAMQALVKDTLSDFAGEVHAEGESDGYASAVAAARANNNCAPSRPALVLQSSCLGVPHRSAHV